MQRNGGGGGAVCFGPPLCCCVPHMSQAVSSPAREHPKNTGVQGNTLHGGDTQGMNNPAAGDKGSGAFHGGGGGSLGVSPPQGGMAFCHTGVTPADFGVSTLQSLQAASHGGGGGGGGAQPALTHNPGGGVGIMVAPPPPRA